MSHTFAVFLLLIVFTFVLKPTFLNLNKMASRAVLMLELIGESNLSPILIKGNETPEMLQIVARHPGRLASICKLSEIEGEVLESKILEFDLSLWINLC